MAVKYAKWWALKRNPQYLDFSNLGGDCTNFCSQVLYAGGCRMNYTRTYGWYYKNGYDKAPAWTGVDYLYNFLIRDKDVGPIAQEVDLQQIEKGDIIQLSFVEDDNKYNHSLVVVNHEQTVDILNIRVCTHTDDRHDYSLTNYDWTKIRFLHIIGYK